MSPLKSVCLAIAISFVYFSTYANDPAPKPRVREVKGQSKSNDALQLAIDQAAKFQETNQLDSAIVVLKKAINSVGKNSVGLDQKKAMIYFQLGNLYRQKASYSAAVDMFEKGLSIAVKNSMYLMEARILNSLGGLYTETENYEKGLSNCNMALAIYQNKFSDRTKDICLLYANIGNIQIALENFDAALSNLNNALELNKKIKNDYYFSLIYSGIGLSHLEKKEFELAMQNLRLGVESSQKSGNIPSEIANLANIGTVYLEQKKYDEADSILILAQEKAIEVNDKFLIKEVLSVLIKLHKSTGNYKKAFNYQEQLIAAKDSLFTNDLKNKLAVLDLNYENVKKEKEILSLKVQNQQQSYRLNQNKLLIVIGLVVFLVFVLIFTIIVQRNKLRTTHKIAELQNKMFRSQIRPHFIFNVLSSIQTYISNNDSKKAVVFLSKFARLMRNVLEQSQIEFNSITHEVSILSYYLELQQLRFEKGFDFEFNIDEAIDSDVFLIPPLILQPIIENSVEHGINSTSEGGRIEIVFRMEDQDLFVEIIDNGAGIESIKKKNNEMKSLLKTESLSLKLIGQQLQYYNKRMKRDFFLTYEDLSASGSTGTKVTIKMPYQTLNAG